MGKTLSIRLQYSAKHRNLCGGWSCIHLLIFYNDRPHIYLSQEEYLFRWQHSIYNITLVNAGLIMNYHSQLLLLGLAVTSDAAIVKPRASPSSSVPDYFQTSYGPYAGMIILWKYESMNSA